MIGVDWPTTETGLVCPPRFATERNRDRRTLAPEVTEIMCELGEPPMPWQQYVLDVGYELDEEATEEASSAAGVFQPRLWYRENDLTVPRQSGKTTKAKARHIHRMRKSREYGWAARPLSFYMAQTAMDARDKMVEDWFPALEECPAFYREDEDGKILPDSPIQKFVRANGREAIKWLGGGRVTLKPPSRTGGHGGSPDLIDLDEAFAHQDGAAEQGVRPGMITKTSPQLWVVSTAGTAKSVYLWGKVDSGRAQCVCPDPTSRRAYFEWSAYPGELNSDILQTNSRDIDMRDPAVLYRCSPALGYTITLENLLADIGMMDPDEAARAYGNIWTSSVSRPISVAAWNRCFDKNSQPGPRLWMAVDASPGGEHQRRGSISIAARRADGLIHVETIANEEGLAWIPAAVAKLTREHAVEMLYLDAIGPIGSVLPAIRQTANANIDVVDATTMANACTAFHEAAVTATLRHRGQASLDQALDGAAQRTLLDSWAWSRSKATADISPLVSCTLAFWGCHIVETASRYEIV